jgi:hypothetical protein
MRRSGIERERGATEELRNFRRCARNEGRAGGWAGGAEDGGAMKNEVREDDVRVEIRGVGEHVVPNLTLTNAMNLI